MKMSNPFKSRSARAQVHYTRHAIKQIELANPLVTQRMTDAQIAACTEWNFDPATRPADAQALHAEMDLLEI
jgi:hypothetical protein